MVCLWNWLMWSISCHFIFWKWHFLTFPPVLDDSLLGMGRPTRVQTSQEQEWGAMGRHLPLFLKPACGAGDPCFLRCTWKVLVEIGFLKLLLKQSVSKVGSGSFSLLPWLLWEVPLYLKAASSSPAFTGDAYGEGTFSFPLRRSGKFSSSQWETRDDRVSWWHREKALRGCNPTFSALPTWLQVCQWEWQTFSSWWGDEKGRLKLCF